MTSEKQLGPQFEVLNKVLQFQLNLLRGSLVITGEKTLWTDGWTDRHMDGWRDGQDRNIYAIRLLGGGIITLSRLLYSIVFYIHMVSSVSN